MYIPEYFILHKTENSYYFTNRDNTIVSTISYFDYDMGGFDWILLADVETIQEYRNRGLASSLINRLYSDITETTDKGLYLFVLEDNDAAISLYTKLGFIEVKTYTFEHGEHIDTGTYIIMAKGNQDLSQFDDMDFA